MTVSVLNNTPLNAQLFETLCNGCANPGCRQFVEALLLEINYLRSEILQLKSEKQSLIDQLKDEARLAQELYEKANLGSDTSGIPGSKDWKNNGNAEKSETQGEPDGEAPEKETPISVSGYMRGGEKKERGGQKNHSPTFMHFDAQEIKQVPCYPGQCVNCPHLDQCLAEGRVVQYTTSHGYDIKIVLIKNEYHFFESKECPLSGLPIRGNFSMVTGGRFYDTNIQLFVLVWHHLFHGSYERISLAAKELFSLSLGAGTANAIYHRISSKILGSRFMDALRFYFLLFVNVLGLDETSARVAGINAWVHTAVSDGATLLTAHWRRGYEGATFAGLLQFYIYTIISDCWSAYFKDNLRAANAICCCHILRELVAAAYFRYQSWAIEMFDLLLELLWNKKEAMERGEKGFAQEYLDEIRKKFKKILMDGYTEINGETKGKTFSLLERLNKLEDSVLAFALDFDVKFTNNASEQSLRDLKVALGVIGQFNNMSGLADYCIVQSFMDTCRKQGLNPLDMIKIVLSGGDIIEAVFGAQIAAPIWQMIRLADAISTGGEDQINAAKVDISFVLSENLLEAASFGKYSVCDNSPPENKKSSSDAHKDKMQIARERNKLKDSSNTNLSDNEVNGQKARAAPISA